MSVDGYGFLESHTGLVPTQTEAAGQPIGGIGPSETFDHAGRNQPVPASPGIARSVLGLLVGVAQRRGLGPGLDRVVAQADVGLADGNLRPDHVGLRIGEEHGEFAGHLQLELDSPGGKPGGCAVDRQRRRVGRQADSGADRHVQPAL